MPNEVLVLIQTGISAGILLLAGLVLKKIQEWLLKLMKVPTAEQKAVQSNFQALTKLLDLTSTRSELRETYKSETRSAVSRSVEIIISKQRENARKIIEQVVGITDRSASLFHEFKAAGESLKPQMVKIYMDSVDTNGFVEMSDQSWTGLITALFEAVKASVRDHYETWYIGKEVTYHEIEHGSVTLEMDIFTIHGSVLNKIKEQTYAMKEAKAKIGCEIQALIAELAKPKKGGLL